jgi:putative ABC transport system permease protein
MDSGFQQLLTRFVVRDLSRNWIRTFLTVAGIALGVAVMLAINLANGTALDRFRESIDLVAGKANLQVHSQAGTDIDEQVLKQLEPFRSQVKYTAVIDESAVVPSTHPDLVEVLGVDMFADPEFRPFDISSSSSGGSSSSEISIFNRDAAYVGAKFAERHNLKVGDYFEVLMNDRAVKLQVAGVISYNGPGRAFGGNLLVMDIACAQDAFNMFGRISRIDIIAPEQNFDATAQQLRSAFASPLIVERPERRSQQVEKMIASFQYNLAALSLIALLVGMFLIYNTMSITVIRKRTEIGILRALGSSRKMIFAIFTVQALLMGGIGSLLGLGLGYVFSRGAVKAVGSTVQSLYVDQPPADVSIDPTTLLIAFVAGLVISLVAALGPVWEAISVSPAEASRRASYEWRVARASGALSLCGIVLLIFAAFAAQLPALDGFPVFGYVSAALTIFGVAFLMPVILTAVMKLVRPLMPSLFRSEGKLALLGLSSTLGRTSVAVASLMLGIAMMISLAIMIGSFRETVIVWVNQTLKADLYIAPRVRTASNKGTISNEVVDRIRAVPGIADTDAFVETPIEYKGNPTNLGAGDADVLSRRGNLLFLDRMDPNKVLGRMEKEDVAAITESFALRNGIKVGDRIEIPGATGKQLSVEVAGIYYDYASDLGYIIIPRRLYQEHFPNDFSSTVAVYAEPNTDVEALRERILSAIGSDVRLNVRTNRDLRVEILRIFDNTFAITYALHAIAILVAILGVMNALFALTYESRREFAILSYVGASVQQLRKIVLIQAALLGVFGNISGLIVGFVLSLLLINVINKQSFGWTVQLSIPTDFIIQSSLLVLLFALISGLIPARLAVRSLSPEALRYE